MSNIITVWKSKTKSVIRYLGYDIIKKTKSDKISEGSDSDDILVLKDNFKELCNGYEYLFSRQFGMVPKDQLRTDIMQRLKGTGPSEAYFLIHSLDKTKEIDGDICEFGVAQGETSSLIANEISLGSKVLHLFEGLPKPTKKDILKNDIFKLGNIEAYEGTMNCPEQMVLNRLKKLNFPEDRYYIHKGFIERLITEKEDFPSKVAFAYLDFDFYEPTKIVLNFLDTVMDKNAIILVDDYDSFSTGAKSAVDEFIAEKNKSEIKYEIFIPDKVFGCFALLTRI
jgi:O-methyltransferase